MIRIQAANQSGQLFPWQAWLGGIPLDSHCFHLGDTLINPIGLGTHITVLLIGIPYYKRWDEFYPDFRPWLIWLLTIHSSSIDTNVPLEVWDVITSILKSYKREPQIQKDKKASSNPDPFSGAKLPKKTSTGQGGSSPSSPQKVPRIPSHPFFKREIYFIPNWWCFFCKICGKLKQGVYIDVSPSGNWSYHWCLFPGVSQVTTRMTW